MASETNKSISVTIRILKSLYARIKKMAAEEKRKPAQMAAILLEEALEGREKKNQAVAA